MKNRTLVIMMGIFFIYHFADAANIVLQNIESITLNKQCLLVERINKTDFPFKNE